MNPAKAAPSAPVKKNARFASDFRVRNLARSAKFFRHKKRRIVQNDAAKTKVSSVDIPTGWDPRTKQQRRVALADFSAAPWQGFEKSERGPNSSSLFQPLAAVVAVALGWLLALPAAGPCCSNPSRSQSQRVTYVYFAIHDPKPPGHNPHCHVMLTMRAMDEHTPTFSRNGNSNMPRKRRRMTCILSLWKPCKGNPTQSICWIVFWTDRRKNAGRL